MAELTERQENVLALVVREYVENAQPVGSETLRRLGLIVSSATIRNELAVLEELGFLTHPHTSAGRMPTERGYRYFVESLMEDFELSVVDQRMIRHQFHQVTLDIDQWMRLAAAVLAHASHGAAIVTAPQSTRCKFKHIQLVSISDQVALLVLVLQEGSIKQQMLALAEPITQEEMTRASNRLNANFASLNVEQIRSSVLPLSQFEAGVVRVVVDLMQQLDSRTAQDVYRDGIMDILRQPEFSASERMQALLEMLEQRSLLEQMLSNLAPERGVQVVIGGESQIGGMSDYSMVLSRYGLPGEASGIVSVLGPIRMHYPRTIGVVRYVSSLLDDLMARMYGRINEYTCGGRWMMDETKENQNNQPESHPESLASKSDEEKAVVDMSDIEQLKQALEQERAKSAETLDNWRRAAADFSNYKKRAEKDAAEMSKFLNATLIARLLPVLDDFDRAMQTIPEHLRGLTWIDGVMLISRKMQLILENEGLKPIEALNKPFDPNVHEAVIHEETDQAEDGTVIAELQRGYKLGERVLRPTMVKVAKKK